MISIHAFNQQAQEKTSEKKAYENGISPLFMVFSSVHTFHNLHQTKTNLHFVRGGGGIYHRWVGGMIYHSWLSLHRYDLLSRFFKLNS